MNHRASSCGVACRMLAALAAALIALPCAAQAPVPVEQEPHHRLRFENAHLRVFDVLIPAGTATLWHTHALDGLGIRLADARVREEPEGAPATEVDMRRGEVGYAANPRPMTHRVAAPGPRDYRTLFVELRLPSGVADVAEPAGAGVEVLLDNPRLRAVRRTLAPGESSGMHAHALPGLGVAVVGGTLEFTLPDGSTRTATLADGDFQWRDAGARHALRNLGPAPVVLVDVELK